MLDSAFKQNPHRRLNLLTREWVLVSPHRTQRPWQGQVEKTAPETAPQFEPTCYLCPGNERAGGVRNPKYESTFVFENDFAALKPDTASLAHNERGVLVAESERGICRVLCFSPRHDLTLSKMSKEEIQIVVDLWTEQYLDLGGIEWINHVQIFENRGAMMGASNPHPHGQIWANATVPNEPANEHFAVVVPFWAVWPFETLLLSRRHLASFDQLSEAERDGLADVLRRITTRYDNVFETSFPYSMGFHQRPTDGQEHAEWHFHAHFYPPLLRSATVRKFMVGYEMLCGPQRDITPERAAERLRTMSEVRFG
jgi:UDPglucose--hexose-1-phosphate uridylyltransferase